MITQKSPRSVGRSTGKIPVDLWNVLTVLSESTNNVKSKQWPPWCKCEMIAKSTHLFNFIDSTAVSVKFSTVSKYESKVIHIGSWGIFSDKIMENRFFSGLATSAMQLIRNPYGFLNLPNIYVYVDLVPSADRSSIVPSKTNAAINGGTAACLPSQVQESLFLSQPCSQICSIAYPWLPSTFAWPWPREHFSCFLKVILGSSFSFRQ